MDDTVTSGHWSPPQESVGSLQSFLSPMNLSHAHSGESSDRFPQNASAWHAHDDEVLSDAFRDETPKVIASVLALMPQAKAIGVLTRLPRRKRSQTLLALATLKRVSAPSRTALLAELARKIDHAVNQKHRSRARSKRLTEILRHCDPEKRVICMQHLTDQDPEMAFDVGSHLFRFSEISHLPDHDLNRLIRHVSLDVLAIAVQPGRGPVLDVVLDALSDFGRQRLLNEIDYAHASTHQEIIAARRIMVTVATKLGLSVGG